MALTRTACFGLIGAAAVCACLASGCSYWSAKRMEVIKSKAATDPDLASELHQRGVKMVRRGNSQAAERLFNEALTADENYGPAHNNLGLLYFQRRDLYSAAHAFQRAVELIPNRPEPHNNLGLTMEAAGRLDDAVEAYTMALRIAPQNAESLGNLIRARLERGDPIASLRGELQHLIFIDRRPEWIEWAEQQLAVFLPAEGRANSVRQVSHEQGGPEPKGGPETIPTPPPESRPVEVDNYLPDSGSMGTNAPPERGSAFLPSPMDYRSPASVLESLQPPTDLEGMLPSNAPGAPSLGGETPQAPYPAGMQWPSGL